jgi:uncharacterized protein YegP (UPF0339 family)
MKVKNKLIVLLLLSLSLYSCEDILEEDISNDMVQITYPQNNQDIYSNVVNFQWIDLEGADKYRVQVYNADSNMILDSLVSTNHLSYPIAPGDYQWRIRGENSAYNSNYTFNFNFSVFLTSDLSNQQVILANPSDNFYTNNTSVILNWQSLVAATSYSFELINVTNSESIVNQQSNLTSTSLSLNNTILVADAEYRWKVKAVNSTGQTVFATRKFYLDRNNPNTSTNTLPVNNNATQTVNQSINFSWAIPPDVGTIQSSISYTIEFSNDINFTSILQSSDSNTTSFQQSFSTAGEYYWRIKAKDLAGNSGLYSAPFKFTVN